MNKIYKITSPVLTGETVVTSVHITCQNDLISSNIPQHPARYPSLTTSRFLHIAISALLFTAFSNKVLAQQITYDGSAGPNKTLPELAGSINGGLPVWMGLNVTDQGLIYRLSNNTVTSGADLLINNMTGITPQFVIGGHSESGSEVKQNTVTLKHGNISGPIHAGLSFLSQINDDITRPAGTGSNMALAPVILNTISANANQNTAVINASLSSVTADIYGGRATIWAQAGQTETGETTGSVSAYSNSMSFVNVSDVNIIAQSNNILVAPDSAIIGDLYGGHAQLTVQAANSKAGNVSAPSNIFTRGWSNIKADVVNLTANNNNIMVDQNSSITGNVHGGYVQLTAHAAKAISGGTLGYSPSNHYADSNADAVVSNIEVTASGNTVTVEQNSAISGSLYGSYIDFSVAGGHATGGTINGVPDKSTAQVNVTNAKIVADDNTVIFTGALQNGAIYGGYVSFDITQGNAIKFDNTPGDDSVSLISNDVSVQNNIVTIGDNAQFNGANTSLYGGFLDYNITDDFKPNSYNLFTGNTLNYSAKTLATLDTIANFEHYNFTLNPDHANNNTALITANDIVLDANSDNISDGSTTASNIKVVGIHAGDKLKAGDEFILMQANNNLTGIGATHLTNVSQAQQGIALLYDVQTYIDTSNKIITATILGSGSGAYANPQLKALSEGYLASAQLVLRGADLMVHEAFAAIDQQNHYNGWVPFVIISGQNNRYKSGSSIRSKDLLLTTGLSYQQDNLTLAALAESGWGSYDTANYFSVVANSASKNVDSSGHDGYYGLGLLGKYHFSDTLYADASLRFGRANNTFDSYDIQNINTNQFAHYSIKNNYISAHLSAGYIVPINEGNAIDLSAKYLWTRLSGKSITVAGDDIEFKSLQSHRVRLNAMFNHQHSNTATLYAGLGYEYEFNAKAKATALNAYAIDAPSLKGSTGIASVGLLIPSDNQRLSVDVKVNGYIGKREGVSTSFKVNYAF